MAESLISASISAGGSSASISLIAAGSFYVDTRSQTISFSNGLFAVIFSNYARNGWNTTKEMEPGYAVVFAGDTNISTPPYRYASGTAVDTSAKASMTTSTLTINAVITGNWQETYYQKSGTYRVVG